MAAAAAAVPDDFKKWWATFINGGAVDQGQDAEEDGTDSDSGFEPGRQQQEEENAGEDEMASDAHAPAGMEGGSGAARDCDGELQGRNREAAAKPNTPRASEDDEEDEDEHVSADNYVLIGGWEHGRKRKATVTPNRVQPIGIEVQNKTSQGLVIMGKANGTGFLKKMKGLVSRSGRPTVPSRLLDDDTSQGGRGVRGRAPRGGEGGGRAPKRGKKPRSLDDIGGSSLRTSYSEVPVESEEEEFGEGRESEEEVREEEDVEEEEVEEEDGEEEAGEEGFHVDLVGLPAGGPKGWLRGCATLPKLPATKEQKWLIVPEGTANWKVEGPGRVPNGVITILLKEYWPGLYCPGPDPELRVLAMSWEHYEAASVQDYGTAAKAVINNFWKYYRVREENKATADVYIVAVARKQARQIQYETRWTAISHYYHNALGQKMPKKEAQRLGLTLRREQYSVVIPPWCYGKRDGWERLVDMWVGQDAEFAAKSRRNKANRGKDGTHIQGNRSHFRFKEVQEKKLKKPLSDMLVWKLARVRPNSKEGEGNYYGKTEEHLTTYTSEFQRFNPESDVADPIELQTDERVVVAIRPRYHGRQAVLDGVITPSIPYTRLRATNPTLSRSTTRSQPSLASENVAYSKYVKLKREELQEYSNRVQANDEFYRKMMMVMFASMTNKTTPEPMGAPPPPAGPMPELLSFEQWISQQGCGTLGTEFTVR